MVGVLAPATRAVVFAHLRSMLAAAGDDERIAKNTCSARSVTQPRAVQRPVVPWKPYEVAAVRTNLPERYRVAVDLGADCGLRHASALLDARESIKALASYLGHTDPRIHSPRHTHLMPFREERTRQAIDNLFPDVGGIEGDALETP